MRLEAGCSRKKVATVGETTIPMLLERWADDRPDDVAYTFIDYEGDPAGTAATLTWAELREQVNLVAAALLEHGSPGDRVAVLAPQSMEYIVGFLGAIAAGFVAVPLPLPQFGQHDERITGALADCAPIAVLTTSPVVDGIRKYTHSAGNTRPMRVIEIDGLDFFLTADTGDPVAGPRPAVAYLQYTSGSTRLPAGVMITHHNVMANLEQLVGDYQLAGESDLTTVSWLPFYHDMGLVIGMFIPLFLGQPGVITTPVAFMQKPARWLQNLAQVDRAFTAAPNFAFELALSRTPDEELTGLDLSGVEVMINGAERVHASTLRRFNGKFGKFGLPDTAVRPSYGLAEATVYVASSPPRPATTVRLDADQLAVGRAEPAITAGLEMVGCGSPRTSGQVRIVDTASFVELPSGAVGEIWVHGEHVAAGYWHNPTLSASTFGGLLTNPSPGTPPDPWLRTGDLGVVVGGELFIIGRIKDLLIVDGRNHYPDDIEATVIEMTAGRVAAVSVPEGTSERLVVIAEIRNPDWTRAPALKTRVTSAVAVAHGVRVSDLLFVDPGSLPITTSGKVRRSLSAEHYRQGRFTPQNA